MIRKTDTFTVFSGSEYVTDTMDVYRIFPKPWRIHGIDMVLIRYDGIDTVSYGITVLGKKVSILCEERVFRYLEDELNTP